MQTEFKTISERVAEIMALPHDEEKLRKNLRMLTPWWHMPFLAFQHGLFGFMKDDPVPGERWERVVKFSTTNIVIVRQVFEDEVYINYDILVSTAYEGWEEWQGAFDLATRTKVSMWLFKATYKRKEGECAVNMISQMEKEGNTATSSVTQGRSPFENGRPCEDCCS